MFCPNCGKNCREANFCPQCGTKLPEWIEPLEGFNAPLPQPAEKRVVLAPEEIPAGKYDGALSSIVMAKDFLIIERNFVTKGTVRTKIPYDQLTNVAFFRAKGLMTGSLIVRWTGNQYLPIPTKGMAAEDATTVCFGEKQNDIFYPIYCAIKKAVDRNNTFHKGENGSYTIRCPRCQSTDVSMRRRGYDALGGTLGTLAAPGVGHLMGNLGENDLLLECAQCGFRWQIQ